MGKVMRHLDLFSGIGGFALACKWVGGIETIGFVEINPFCQKVLHKHWPNVPIKEDIRSVTGYEFRDVDIITGGFPCQDISNANTNKPKGLEGERSGLWREYKRLVSTIRPRYVIVENTSALLFRGLSRVLGDFSEMGYDAEWKVISAQEVGAPHKRERVWIVADSRSEFGFDRFIFSQNSGKSDAWDKDKEKWGINRQFTKVGDTSIPRLVEEQPERYCNPDFLRISNGMPDQLDRLKSLGNAIVPQVAYQILSSIYNIEVARLEV